MIDPEIKELFEQKPGDPLICSRRYRSRTPIKEIVADKHNRLINED
jgi:hypothetical protein